MLLTFSSSNNSNQNVKEINLIIANEKKLKSLVKFKLGTQNFLQKFDKDFIMKKIFQLVRDS